MFLIEKINNNLYVKIFCRLINVARCTHHQKMISSSDVPVSFAQSHFLGLTLKIINATCKKMELTREYFMIIKIV